MNSSGQTDAADFDSLTPNCEEFNTSFTWSCQKAVSCSTQNSSIVFSKSTKLNWEDLESKIVAWFREKEIKAGNPEELI